MSIDMDKHFVVGKRAIRIPLYVECKNDLFDFYPKWKDTVIYEPSPFRLWKTEAFNLSEIYEGTKQYLVKLQRLRFRILRLQSFSLTTMIMRYPGL